MSVACIFCWPTLHSCPLAFERRFCFEIYCRFIRLVCPYAPMLTCCWSVRPVKPLPALVAAGEASAEVPWLAPVSTDAAQQSQPPAQPCRACPASGSMARMEGLAQKRSAARPTASRLRCDGDLKEGWQKGKQAGLGRAAGIGRLDSRDARVQA